VSNGLYQVQKDNSNLKNSVAVWNEAQLLRQILSKKKCREADHAPSGLHQEQIEFDGDKKSQAVCSKRPK
jgi:hypothetical protein